MLKRTEPPKLAELGLLFRTFCQKHRIRRLDVFGSVARGQMTAASDLDLLVTPDEINPPSTAALQPATRVGILAE